MANVFFQGAQVYQSSGTTDGVYALIQRVQDCRIDYQIPRTTVSNLGRFKPLNDQPVINYTPVSLSVNFLYSNKDVPRNLGILNSTGMAVQIGQGTTVADWGARSFQIYNSPVTSTNYAGQWNVVSGIIKSFALAGSVGDAVKGSFNAEALDLQQAANVGARTYPTYSGNLIKPENVTIAGIDFNGLGYSGLIVQSFNLQVSYDHAQTFRLGTKYPERRMTSAGVSLQLSAFMEGTTNTVTSLTGYDPGAAMTGAYTLTLTPSCGNDPATTITLTNPYLMSQSLGVQVGNFIQVDLSFALPLSIVPFEATGAGMGSNATLV